VIRNYWIGDSGEEKSKKSEMGSSHLSAFKKKVTLVFPDISNKM
jgi:hypothetical protein